jgi:NTE family protein
MSSGKKKYKTGLVLSGGGTRGFAHLGVIAALRDKGIRPDVISGVSAGAIAGAFTAGGLSPEKTMQILQKGWFFRYTKIHLPVDGLLKLDGLKEVIRNQVKYKNLEDLPIPLFVAVSNLHTGEVEYLNQGPLDQLVLASSSIPVLFAPVRIQGQTYVDGGLLDNLPINPIKNDCEEIIVVNISPLNPREKFDNLVQIMTRTFYMSVNTNMDMVRKHASVFIEPEGIDKYDILTRTHAEELFELGYHSLENSMLKKKNS